jgi:putative transposase
LLAATTVAHSGLIPSARRRYGFFAVGYVVMPEHVHLLVSEPERDLLATAIQAMKQSVARRRVSTGEHLWQPRYYDFNVWSEKKQIEQLRYIPVKRGLVQRPEDWEWSSFRHYATGEKGIVALDGGPWPGHPMSKARSRFGYVKMGRKFYTVGDDFFDMFEPGKVLYLFTKE